MVRTNRARQAQLIIAMLIGALFGVGVYFEAHLTDALRTDFDQAWFAARAMLAGKNPYPLIGPEREFYWAAGFLYPLPAAFLAVPLAPLPWHLASVVFAGFGIGVLAWTFQQRSRWHLLLLLTPPVFVAADAAQWSPLLSGALLLPSLGIVLVAKPTVGAAIWIARPSWSAVVVGMSVIVGSFIVQPDWFGHWLAAVRANATAELVFNVDAARFSYGPPVLRPGGVFVLLALLRWRLWEARLIAVLACVPQAPWAYELVPLLLVPRTPADARALFMIGGVGAAVGWWFIDVTDPPRVAVAWAWMGLVFYYLPATIFVLRRPNEGPAPAWLERAVSRAPHWLRGRTEAMPNA